MKNPGFIEFNAEKVLTAFCGLCFWFAACNGYSQENIFQNGKSTADLKTVNEAPSEIRVPRGDEIALKIEIIRRRTIRLTVSNRSSDTVFLPFLGRLKDKYALSAVYKVEKKDISTGEFNPVDWKSDFSPGIHPLESGDFFRDKTSFPEKGTYRIIFYYLIDRNIAEETVLRSKMFVEGKTLSDDEEFAERQNRSRGTIISEPFTL